MVAGNASRRHEGGGRCHPSATSSIPPNGPATLDVALERMVHRREAQVRNLSVPRVRWLWNEVHSLLPLEPATIATTLLATLEDFSFSTTDLCPTPQRAARAIRGLLVGLCRTIGDPSAWRVDRQDSWQALRKLLRTIDEARQEPPPRSLPPSTEVASVRALPVAPRVPCPPYAPEATPPQRKKNPSNLQELSSPPEEPPKAPAGRSVTVDSPQEPNPNSPNEGLPRKPENSTTEAPTKAPRAKALPPLPPLALPTASEGGHNNPGSAPAVRAQAAAEAPAPAATATATAAEKLAEPSHEEVDAAPPPIEQPGTTQEPEAQAGRATPAATVALRKDNHETQTVSRETVPVALPEPALPSRDRAAAKAAAAAATPEKRLPPRNTPPPILAVPGKILEPQAPPRNATGNVSRAASVLAPSRKDTPENTPKTMALLARPSETIPPPEAPAVLVLLLCAHLYILIRAFVPSEAQQQPRAFCEATPPLFEPAERDPAVASSVEPENPRTSEAVGSAKEAHAATDRNPLPIDPPGSQHRPGTSQEPARVVAAAKASDAPPTATDAAESAPDKSSDTHTSDATASGSAPLPENHGRKQGGNTNTQGNGNDDSNKARDEALGERPETVSTKPLLLEQHHSDANSNNNKFETRSFGNCSRKFGEGDRKGIHKKGDVASNCVGLNCVAPQVLLDPKPIGKTGPTEEAHHEPTKSTRDRPTGSKETGDEKETMVHKARKVAHTNGQKIHDPTDNENPPSHESDDKRASVLGNAETNTNKGKIVHKAKNSFHTNAKSIEAHHNGKENPPVHKSTKKRDRPTEDEETKADEDKAMLSEAQTKPAKARKFGKSNELPGHESAKKRGRSTEIEEIKANEDQAVLPNPTTKPAKPDAEKTKSHSGSTKELSGTIQKAALLERNKNDHTKRRRTEPSQPIRERNHDGNIEGHGQAKTKTNATISPTVAPMPSAAVVPAPVTTSVVSPSTKAADTIVAKSSANVSKGNHAETVAPPKTDAFPSETSTTNQNAQALQNTPIVLPNNTDVLCRDGKLINNNFPGNRKLWQLILQQTPLCKNDTTEYQAISAILRTVLLEGGRFLEQQGSNGGWKEIQNATEIVESIIHCFRFSKKYWRRVVLGTATERDVLFGPAGDTLCHHPGNSYVRSRILELLPHYIGFTEVQKYEAISSIIVSVHDMAGRFLQQSKKNGWEEISIRATIEKIADAIRRAIASGRAIASERWQTYPQSPGHCRGFLPQSGRIEPTRIFPPQGAHHPPIPQQQKPYYTTLRMGQAPPQGFRHPPILQQQKPSPTLLPMQLAKTVNKCYDILDSRGKYVSVPISVPPRETK